MNDETSGLASSQHFIITDPDEAQGFQLAGVTLRPGAYELIEAQLQQMKNAADEGVAVRYVYQMEGVLLTLLMQEEISQANAEALRTFIHGQLPDLFKAMVSVP